MQLMKVNAWPLMLALLAGSCATATSSNSDGGSSSTADGSTGDGAKADGSVADAQQPTTDAAPTADAANTTCLAPIDITAGGTFANQTTIGATDKLSPPLGGNGCPSGGLNSGPDVIYVLSPSVTTQYEITVTPGNGSFDPMLYAMTSCDFDTGCSDGAVLNGPGGNEEIIAIVGTQDVFVVVDGEANTSGPFSLEVVATPL